MGICPRCGSWVDEGEPYCPECCYDGNSSRFDSPSSLPDVIEINCHDYDREDVEEALDILGMILMI